MSIALHPDVLSRTETTTTTTTTTTAATAPATTTRPAVGSGTTPVDEFAAETFTRMASLDLEDPFRLTLRDELICSYLPFARRLARRFSGRGESLDDLTQVATVGLIKSVDRFDINRGIPFANFAGPTVVGELKRHFRDKGWSVRVSRRMQELHLEISRAYTDLAQELGRSVTVADVAARLRIDEDDVLAGLECGSAYATRSLNSAVGTEDGGIELGELIGEPDEQIESLADRQALHQLIQELPEREQRILSLRFFGNLTQSEIADQVGISQMHVSRLLSQTLATLRERLLADPA
jgi:RNA polymerase sigma-B factor